MATNVSDVYLGFWVDQSEENVLLKGKMTISSEVAKFLTAFFVMQSQRERPPPTMLALLGLFPIDYWTNIASFSYADEDLLNEPTSPTRELFVRTTWKRPVAMMGPLGPQAGLVKLRFSGRSTVSSTLYRIPRYWRSPRATFLLLSKKKGTTPRAELLPTAIYH
ncbi:hypothetical protein F4821DRAFT_258541 [Hypoxylon rubiginosum]|uniref:Uncharacterized protein n=1 Tax=Hypoxylon rubiginosum TaxID=110542 RepID=A0ACC0D4X9_9PEZI|nr:hypothetical protein F4821DRAFT_258541 [Hypoxylon rubiginosum]